jgi:DegV family protein with EDD domain
MALTILTDSTCDIDPERARALGIEVVPLFVTFGDCSFRDVVELSRVEFYRRLRGNSVLPTTSQPSTAMFEDAFAAQRSDTILCLVISSQVSGTINAARAAAERVIDKRIVVFDSESASGGLGLMVLRAATMARDGATLEDILKAAEAERRVQKLFACIPDLSHLQRSGRIGRAQAAIGTLIRIVPIIGLENGCVVAKARVRTFARAQEAMLDLALADTNALAARYVVMHTDALELATSIARRLRERLGADPAMLEIWEAGPVIATHAGSGAVGVFVG